MLESRATIAATNRLYQLLQEQGREQHKRKGRPGSETGYDIRTYRARMGHLEFIASEGQYWDPGTDGKVPFREVSYHDNGHPQLRAEWQDDHWEFLNPSPVRMDYPVFLRTICDPLPRLVNQLKKRLQGN